ncbi:hypothetical protein L6164_017372 [Bauhinia variegata]|uniref:Uncharacterized protein n=1 Tax=Bauhinia variegata TaxID=167791 RepID=A0ACB9N8A9_BAUVA|nr:hypothetical protein L6164_017372 [Bauhinia variegata]
MVNQSMRKSLFILVVLGLVVSSFPICASAQNASVSDIVIRRFAKQVFNRIALNADGDSCPGKDFYTLSAFLIALKYYTQFGKLSSIEDSKREIAAAFAHFAHETGS